MVLFHSWETEAQRGSSLPRSQSEVAEAGLEPEQAGSRAVLTMPRQLCEGCFCVPQAEEGPAMCRVRVNPELTPLIQIHGAFQDKS